MPGREYYGKGFGNVANMPQDVVYRDFPEANEGLNIALDDTAKGIDSAIEHNTKYLRSHISDEKY